MKKRKAKRCWINCNWTAKEKKTDKLTPFIKNLEWEKIKDIVLCVNIYPLVYMYSDALLVYR